jgi:hypothetical protein
MLKMGCVHIEGKETPVKKWKPEWVCLKLSLWLVLKPAPILYICATDLLIYMPQYPIFAQYFNDFVTGPAVFKLLYPLQSLCSPGTKRSNETVL